MRTNYKHITAADQRLIKQMAAQAISPLPKRMRDSEKEAILTYFPARFKDYRVTNIVAHIRMWQSFPADTFAQHQARMTAKHTNSHFGLFQEVKEAVSRAVVEKVTEHPQKEKAAEKTCANCRERATTFTLSCKASVDLLLLILDVLNMKETPEDIKDRVRNILSELRETAREI